MSGRKILKALGYAAASLAAVLLASAATVYAVSHHKLNRRLAVPVTSVQVPTGATAIERGRHLAETRGCVDCHGSDFGGAKVVENAAIGAFHGPNLTRGAGGLPGDFAEADYVRAIRHGLARDGRPLILMPSAEYTALSDEDLGAMIAFLKSVPPVDRPRGPVSPGPLFHALSVAGKIKLSADAIDHGAPRPKSVPITVSAEYGKYLAAGCTGCHGANFAGGRIPGAPPDWPAAANLTPHQSTRISAWTVDQFVSTLRTGRRPDGTPVNPVMPGGFGKMNDTELHALWTYLRSLPAVATTSSQ